MSSVTLRPWWLQGRFRFEVCFTQPLDRAGPRLSARMIIRAPALWAVSHIAGRHPGTRALIGRQRLPSWTPFTFHLHRQEATAPVRESLYVVVNAPGFGHIHLQAAPKTGRDRALSADHEHLAGRKGGKTVEGDWISPWFVSRPPCFSH
jgi:hypothetical protein